MDKKCACGDNATGQGYCFRCLREFEKQIANDVKVEQFEMYATQPRTYEDIETEQMMFQDQEINEMINPGGLMSLKITNIRIKLFNSGKMRGFASLTINDKLAINGVKIFDSVNGLFAAFPKTEPKEGKEAFGIVFPVDKDLKQQWSDEIITAYEAEVPEHA